MFSSHTNPILLDVRKYRTERLRMNNPKGWDHILRKFEYAVTEGGAFVTNEWARITNPEHIAHARAVLERLARAWRLDTAPG